MIDRSDGTIRAVLIVDLQYEVMAKGRVSLLLADEDSGSYWAQRSIIFHDDALAQQPTGQVGLYISDFHGLAGLPNIYCRPTTAELAAGINRFVLSS